MINDLDWRKWLHESGDSDHFKELEIPLAELNLELLQLLARTAQSPPQGCSQVVDLQPELLKVDGRVLERLAQVPISLIDIGRMIRNQNSTVHALEEEPTETERGNRGLDEPATIRLAHSALTLVWTAMRSSREMARLIFGLNARSAADIAQLGIQGIQRLAQRAPDRLHLRWNHRPHVWRELIGLAHQQQSGRIPMIEMRALQYHLTDIIRPAADSLATGASAENRAGRK